MLTKKLSSFSNHWVSWGILSTLLMGLCLANAWFGFPFFATFDAMYSAIGGVISYSDASAYIHGGQYFQELGYLDYWNMRRPLNGLFFAFRLNITGGNFWYTMGIQVALCAAALTLYLKTIQESFSTASTFLSLAFVFYYALNFVHTTLSETLGLTLGLLSFVLLLNGFQSKNRRIFCTGIASLTVALSARAGPNFMIPAIFFLIFLEPLTSSRLKDLFWCILAFVVTIVFMTALSYFFAPPELGGAAHANFSHTLFGLVSGGKSWLYVYQDPHIKTLIEGKAEADIAKILYTESWKAFINNPLNLLIGMGKYLGGFLYYFIRQTVFGTGLVRIITMILTIAGLLFVGLRFFAKRHLFYREFLFILIIFSGIAASSCITWQDGGIRPYAVAIPFIGILFGFAFARKNPNPNRIQGNLWSICLVSFIVLGSVSTKYLPSQATIPDVSGLKQNQSNGQRMILTYKPSIQPFLLLSDSNELGLNFRTLSKRQIRTHEIYRIHDSHSLELIKLTHIYKFEDLALLYVYDFISHSNVLIVSEKHIIDSNAKWLTINTSLVNSDFNQIYKANNYTELPQE